MNLFKTVFELFVLYMLYKLVVDFIIPVYRASKRMKEQVGQMQQKMQEQHKQQSRDHFVNTDTPPSSDKKASDKDYIDFEEIK